MSFLVEDGTGVESANSYEEVDYADDYHTERGNTDWSGTNDEKETYLIRGTDYIERRWGPELRGIREFPEIDGLSFPRLYLYNRDGYLITGIPTKLKQALAEYALIAKTDGALLPTPTVDDSLTREKKKVGPIETEKEWSEFSATGTFPEYPIADALMAEFVGARGGRSHRV